MRRRAAIPVFLLTDYGTHESFAGQLRAVIAARAPASAVHDLSHDIEPFAVDQAAWTLQTVLPHLPRPAIVLAVVDPGVGTERRSIAVRTGRTTIVGPDNGLFAWAADANGKARDAIRAREIRPGNGPIPVPRSATFHGRDLYAPVAALLAAHRLRFRDLGPRITTVQPLPAPLFTTGDDGSVDGRVIRVDRFGNLMTTIPAAALPGSGRLLLGDRPVDGPVHTFADIPGGEVRWYIDSAEHIAIAANQGSAAALLGAGPGTPVTMGTG